MSDIHPQNPAISGGNMTELERLCEKHGITITCKYAYIITLKRTYKVAAHTSTIRRRLTTSFYQGPAHTQEPTAADVLGCLCRDARAGEMSLEEFCSAFGYDIDSRKAEATHKACERIRKKLTSFLGNYFDTFADAEY